MYTPSSYSIKLLYIPKAYSVVLFWFHIHVVSSYSFFLNHIHEHGRGRFNIIIIPTH